MISKDKQYRTRDGREVRIYATDGEHNQAVHGAAKTNGEWVVYAWYSNGVYARSDRNAQHDLIEVKPRHKRTVWLNVYDGSDHGSYYDTKLDADADAAVKHQKWPRIACIRVDLDFEEGQGL